MVFSSLKAFKYHSRKQETAICNADDNTYIHKKTYTLFNLGFTEWLNLANISEEK